MGDGDHGEQNKQDERAVSRRRWLRNLLPLAAEAVATVAEAGGEGPVRPPGALREPDFLALCTRCGDCADACPHGTVFTFNEDQGALGGTPVLFTTERPCRQCDGFPCAAACKTGALAMPRGRSVRLGSARIVEERCLPFSGPECGACAGLCPTDRALKLERGRPRIDQELCTGCGMCIVACPVAPSAIEALT